MITLNSAIFSVLLILSACLCIMKLTACGIKTSAGFSFLWGIAAFGIMLKMCETADIINIFASYSNLLPLVIFIDCGVMIAWVMKPQSILKYYPGFSIAFSIAALSLPIIFNFPGIPFIKIASGYGFCTAVAIFALSFLLGKVSGFRKNLPDFIYYTTLAVILSCIIYCGISSGV